MLNKSEQRKLNQKKKEWDGIIQESNGAWEKIVKEAKKVFKDMMNFMMYYKPKDKYDRAFHTFEWWFIVALIFFAFKGFTYWATGR